MSVRVRLTRVGSKKNPIWRVVVADQRSARDGRTIETLGHYNPQTEPSTIVIDRERLDHWIEQGAQPSDSVRKLMRAPNTSIPQPGSSEEAPAEAAADAEESAVEVAVAEAGEAEAHATEVSEVEESTEAEAAAADEATPESDAQVEGDADAAADDASS